jgi:hypothetical protein
MGYVIQVNVDPAGYIPSSFVATVATEIPMCIARIRTYLADYGFPPYIPHHAETFPGTLQNETYDHPSKVLDVRWKPHGAGSFNIYYDRSRWTDGVTIVPGETTSENDFKVVQSEGKITIEFDGGVKDKNLQITVEKA